MRLSDLGERKAIELFTKRFGESKDVALGIGDDACALEINGKGYLVLSTDMIAQGTHIPKEMTPLQVGMYVVNVNLSDIASMGAKPVGILLSLGLPRDLDESYIAGLSEGIETECRRHKIAVLGGDTKEAKEIVITGAAIGRVDKEHLLRRNGAKVGDLICVTGSLGMSAAGFYTLVKNLDSGKKVISAALEPKARVREGILLGRYASACMDISDGLAYSLHEISRQSETGFRVEECRIPVEEGVRAVSMSAGVPLRELIFHRGGDFELLFTVAKKKMKKLEEEMKELDTGITVIGEVTIKGENIVRQNGAVGELESRGHEAFLSGY